MATMAQRIKADRRNEQGGVFRVLIGSYLGQGPEGCDCDTCQNGDPKNHRYRAAQRGDPEDYDGDIIESGVDLCARFNAGSGSIKFERLLDDGQQPQPARPRQQQAAQQQPPPQQQPAVGQGNPPKPKPKDQ